jgi:hypothetical protein
MLLTITTTTKQSESHESWIWILFCIYLVKIRVFKLCFVVIFPVELTILCSSLL